MSEEIEQVDPRGMDSANKNRAVFNDVSIIAGMPAGLFLLGIVMCVGMYAASRTVFAVLIIGPAYFIPMYSIHKNDLRGLQVWLSIFNDSVNTWECARRTNMNLIFRHEPGV